MRRLYTANSIQLKRMIKMRIDEILAKKRTDKLLKLSITDIGEENVIRKNKII